MSKVPHPTGPGAGMEERGIRRGFAALPGGGKTGPWDNIPRTVVSEGYGALSWPG